MLVLLSDIQFICAPHIEGNKHAHDDVVRQACRTEHETTALPRGNVIRNPGTSLLVFEPQTAGQG